MSDKINLTAKLASFDNTFSPKIVAYLNDYKVYVGKVKGDFVWHQHEDTDELFLVLKGCLVIQLRDRDVELAEGELFVVSRGVEHCPRSDEEAHVLVIEPRETRNTGNVENELTTIGEEI
jgi:mannose-6-phosphate isomerase-like protein (cupin superfamily)